MEPANGSPRPSPFVAGRRYRVRKDFTALRDRFVAGEVLVFVRETWSRYDECRGYVFTQPDSEVLRVWDIADNEDLAVWSEFFEPLTDEPAVGA